MGEKIAAGLSAVEDSLQAVLFVRMAVLFHFIVRGYFYFINEGVRCLTGQEKTAWATEQLCRKFKETGRLPKKEDFDDKTRSRIKSFLGPWPRALEKAGLKPVMKTKNN